MAIVTYEYYTNTYYGEPIAQAAFPRYELRAEELIASITRGADYTSLPSAFQTAYKKAICAQVEYYVLQGINVATEGGNSGGAYTIGKVSVGRGSGGNSTSESAAYLSVAPAARMLLEQTGLLNRDVVTIGDEGRGWWY